MKLMEYKHIEVPGKDIRVHETVSLGGSAKLNFEESDHISIDQFCYISTILNLGSYIHIAPQVSIIGGAGTSCDMGDFTNIGAGSKIVCATDNFKEGLISPVVPIKYRDVKYAPVVFEDFATLGVNCSVLPGVNLAIGSIVGAGTTVIKDTEPWGIYVGSPARLIGYRDRNKTLKLAEELKSEL